MKATRFRPAFSPALFLGGILVLLGCMSGNEKAVREIQWRLSDSLKTYDKVIILISDGAHITLDTAYQGKLNNPFALPAYRVPESVPPAFEVHILGMTAQSDTLYAAVTTVDAAGKAVNPAPYAQVLLSRLQITGGTLLPTFTSLHFEYLVPDGSDTLWITAMPVDSLNAMVTLNGSALLPGIAFPATLQTGTNMLLLRIASPDGSAHTVVRMRADHAVSGKNP